VISSWEAVPLAVSKMFNSILTTLQTNAVNLAEWWDSINTTYRAGGCMLLALFLIWEATKASGERDRKFFLTGLAALGLLTYGAVLFVQGAGGVK
jgi:hypothetical protein